MRKMHVWLITAIALSVGCGDSLGPGINGRWAAMGIELVGDGGGATLRLPCTRPVELPRSIAFDKSGHVQFSGSVREQWYSFDFVFAGQLERDALVATLTFSSPGQPPSVSNYRMTQSGEPGLDGMFCLTQ